MNERAERFKYNMDLENALRNLLGQRYYGCAGAFSDVQICKKLLRRAIRRIRRRLNEIITTDERLLLTTSITLDRLERNIKSTSEKTNNDWFIIANFLDLVSSLLGYDWRDGKVHRQVIFYQYKQQEIEDYMKKVGRAFWDEFPIDWRIRFEIVYLLKERKLSNNQIARVLTLSDKLIAKILKRIEDFEKKTGKKFSENSARLPSQFFIV